MLWEMAIGVYILGPMMEEQSIRQQNECDSWDEGNVSYGEIRYDQEWMTEQSTVASSSSLSGGETNIHDIEHSTQDQSKICQTIYIQSMRGSVIEPNKDLPSTLTDSPVEKIPKFRYQKLTHSQNAASSSTSG